MNRQETRRPRGCSERNFRLFFKYSPVKKEQNLRFRDRDRNLTTDATYTLYKYRCPFTKNMNSVRPAFPLNARMHKNMLEQIIRLVEAVRIVAILGCLVAFCYQASVTLQKFLDLQTSTTHELTRHEKLWLPSKSDHAVSVSLRDRLALTLVALSICVEQPLKTSEGLNFADPEAYDRLTFDIDELFHESFLDVLRNRSGEEEQSWKITEVKTVWFGRCYSLEVRRTCILR